MKIFTLILFLTAAIIQKDYYSDLISKLELQKQSELMVDEFVKYFAKQKPGVPDTVWLDIKKTVKQDKSFVADTKKVLMQYYTVQEVKNLIKDIDKYGANTYKPKPEVTEKMYEIGKAYGKKTGEKINAKLKGLGY